LAHVRKSIRDNIVTAVTSLSTTGARVYRSRIYPPETANDLPGLCVYTLREASEADTMGASAHGLAREVDIVVEAYVRATSNYDNTLDTICVEVEEAVATDLTRGGNAKDTLLESAEFELSGEGDQPVAMARLTYSCFYRTAASDVETAI
jgi:hypothetical protein